MNHKMWEFSDLNDDIFIKIKLDGLIDRSSASLKELIGESIDCLNDLESKIAFNEHKSWDEIINSKNDQVFEAKINCKNGNTKLFSWKIKFYLDENYALLLGKDITDVRRFETLSLKLEQASGIGTWEVDLENNTLYWSDQTYRIHEADPASFTPNLEEAINFYHPNSVEKIQSLFQELVANGTQYDERMQLITVKGRTIWVRARGFAQRENNTTKICFGTFEDITVQYEQDKKNLKLNEQLKLAIDATRMGIWEIKDGDIFLDESSKSILAEDRDSFHLAELYSKVAADQKNMLEKYISVFIDKKTSLDLVIRVVVKNRTKYIRIIGAGLETPFTMGVLQDVTHSEKIKQNLKDQTDKAVKANKLKSDFLANMSHEIRTPINGVLGMTELLMETDLKSEQRDMLESVSVSGQNLVRIINDILDYSKMEHHRVILEEIPFSVSKLIQQAENLFSGSKPKDVKLIKKMDDLECDHLIGDPARISQVLNNLLGNAYKFTSSGTVTIDIKTSMLDHQNVFLKIAITDTGIGIEAEKIEILFNPFIQSDASINRRFGGTGLGLSIVHKLIDLMGGSIWVESEVGKGTTFFLQMKLGIAKKSENDSIDLNHTYPNARVLVAEDNNVNIKLMQALLKRFKIVPDIAVDGKEAIEKSQACRYDLIFMDLQMPGVDGIQATKEIRSLGEEVVTIVALTANDMQEDKDRSIEAGMDDFLSKPLSRKNLSTCLNKYLK